jgi:hypothetical protein
MCKRFRAQLVSLDALLSFTLLLFLLVTFLYVEHAWFKHSRETFDSERWKLLSLHARDVLFNPSSNFSLFTSPYTTSRHRLAMFSTFNYTELKNTLSVSDLFISVRSLSSSFTFSFGKSCETIPKHLIRFRELCLLDNETALVDVLLCME